MVNVVIPANLGAEFDIGVLVASKISVVNAADTVKGKVALSVGANYPTDDTAGNDVDATTPLYVKNAIAGQWAGTAAFSTLALMNANLNYPAQTKGQVLADGTPANNGNYIKSGVSGAGSWTYASALAVAANYNGTSTSSIAVGLGTKTLTTQAGLAWTSGQRARFSSITTPADWMEGIVTSYSSTTITISADLTSGSTATYASWYIGLAGQPGQSGFPSGGTLGQIARVIDDFGTLAPSSTSALSTNASYTMDWTKLANYQWGNSFSGSSRVSASTSSTTLVITNNQAAIWFAGCIIGGQAVVKAKRNVVITGNFAVTGANPIGTGGLAIGIVPVGNPASGGGALSNTVALPTGFIGIVIRPGGPIAYAGDGSTGAAGVTVSSVTGSFSFTTGQALALNWTFGSADATTATATFSVAGTITGTFAVSGLPATGWLWYGARMAGNISPADVATITALVTDITVVAAVTAASEYVVDPAAGGSGIGTFASPWTPAQAMAYLKTATDTAIDLWLKRGDHRASYMVDSRFVKRLKVRGEKGKQVRIIPAIQVTSGWTKTAGQTNIYERAATWNGAAVTTSNFGNFVTDVTAGATKTVGVQGASGVAGSYILPFRPYAILADIESSGTLAALDAAPYSSMLGRAAGKLYINANGVDPGTLTMELAQYSTGIGYAALSGYQPQAGADTDWTFSELQIDNVICQHMQGDGVFAWRCKIDARDSSVYGGSSHAWLLQTVSGELHNCKGIGSGGDGFNPVGEAVPSVNAIPPSLTFFRCEGHGNYSVASDGFSNHEGGTWAYFMCKAWGNAKNGFSPVGDSYYSDCDARFNANYGIHSLNLSTNPVICEINGGDFVNNLYNLGITRAAGTTQQLTYRAKGCRLVGSNRGVYLFNGVGGAGDTLIAGELFDLRFSGNATNTINMNLSAINVVSNFTAT